MSVATSTAIAIGAGVSAAGALGGAAISSSAASNAAKTQADAAKSAAQLQKEEADNALAFQKQQWTTQQANLAPWLASGKGALNNLTGLLSTPGQGLLTPWTEQFQAPTAVTEQNDPGYKFRMAQGEGALENSAAAKGSLLSGNTLEAQQKFGQDFASNEYSNVYNRAMQEFNSRYGIFENNNTNTFNRLAALSGVGQTAATTLGSEGQNAANNVSNINLTSGAQQGQQMNNAAAATASGYIGGANAWGGALGNSTNSLSQLMMLNQLFGGGANPISGIDLSAIPDPALTNPAYYGVA
jgi:hypothetical protein